jgi:hypothetical protein
MRHGALAQAFDRLAGPGGTRWEIALTACALVGTVYAAHVSALPVAWPGSADALLRTSRRHRPAAVAPGFTPLQYVLALVIAVIDGSAAVQTATAQSKRHAHGPSGRLSAKFAGVIAFEAVAQAALIGYTFAPGAQAATFALRASAWLAFVSLALFVVPLHAQRPLSVLLFLATVGLDGAGALPPTPGVEWMRIVLPVKYILAHPVRHEPYRYAVD